MNTEKVLINPLLGEYESWLMESLKDSVEASAYLQVSLDDYQEDGNMETLLIALRHVAIAQGGIAQLAKKTNLNRESLYKVIA